VRLEIADNIRDLALFNMAIDCKLRGCDLVRLRVRGVFVSGHMKERAAVMQSKTQRPVQFEITEQTRKTVQRRIESPAMFGYDDLWSSRFHDSLHLSTRQYARVLRGWVTLFGLEVTAYGTHSMRRSKAAQIYKKTGDLRAVQLLLGHTKMDRTVRYLGIELEDALEKSEGIEM
jgi:site-specific recombinase XerC